MHIPYDSAISQLGKTYTRMFILTVFIKSKKLEIPIFTKYILDKVNHDISPSLLAYSNENKTRLFHMN